MTRTSTRVSPPPPVVAEVVPVADTRPSRQRASAGRAAAIVVLSLLFAMLLDADSLASSISEQPFGSSRSFELALVNPVKTISHWTALNRPVQVLNYIFKGGHGHATPASRVGPGTKGPTPSGADTMPGRGLTPGSGSLSAQAAPPVPTAQRPLKVWMAGDSLMGAISESVASLVGHDRRFSVSIDFRIGTGLARPDVFNWIARSQQEVDAANPDVVVLTFGTNDDQDMSRDGHRVALGSAEWQATYAQRVDQILSIVGNGTRQVIWLGIPAVRRARLNHTKDIINQVIKEAVAGRPGVSYLDTGAVLNTPAGDYTTYLTESGGKPVAVRASDGIHLTPAGANRLDPLILAPIQRTWGLTP
jgi:uncharacterized protein